MKAFNNFEEAKKNAQYTGTEKLPAGAYVCKILNVQYQNGENGNSDLINVLFDVVEGDQQDFFKKQYDNNTAEDKKWKGRTTIWVPKDDGSEKDEWTKNSFAKWTNSFEASNAGYTWDWDENKWKGLVVGLNFREAGKNIEGKNVVYTEVAFPVEAQLVRDGKVKPAKFKAYNGYDSNPSETTNNDWMSVPSGVEEIPFN